MRAIWVVLFPVLRVLSTGNTTCMMISRQSNPVNRTTPTSLHRLKEKMHTNEGKTTPNCFLLTFIAELSFLFTSASAAAADSDCNSYQLTNWLIDNTYPSPEAATPTFLPLVLPPPPHLSFRHSAQQNIRILILVLVLVSAKRHSSCMRVSTKADYTRTKWSCDSH